MERAESIRIGLVSDTHAPQRCAALPAALFEALAGCDLILHAGDVGELWVLDRLSAIAPVVAVHGNDDTVEAQRELPYQQLVSALGRRILLWHSHDRDREAEMALRREDAWAPKLARLAAAGQRAGAGIVVYGHTHIPMARQQDGVLLVNPGAIASGSPITRQVRQTVAVMSLGENGSPSMHHVDLADPAQTFQPGIDWPAGFKTALDRYSASILSPELERVWQRMASELLSLAREPLIAATLRVAHRVWAGEQAMITMEDLLREIGMADGMAAEKKERVAAALRAMVAEGDAARI